MKTRMLAGLMVGAVLVTLGATGTARAALYGDADSVTTGDLPDQDYWWAKYDNMMLDLALKQHQPEGKIGVTLAGSKERLEGLVKKYPKHEDIAKWKAHADDVLKQIDPNASRSVPFNPGCPWDESNFAQLWVNFHYGQCLEEHNNFNQAYATLTGVMENYAVLLAPDRMKDYPEDLRKWVVDAKPEAEKLLATAKDKMTH